MKLEKLLGHQPAGFKYMDAAKKIWAYGRYEPLYALTVAIGYGVILGKRMERARRKAAQKEGTTV